MKITPTNNVYNLKNNNILKSPGFNGLWGKSSSNSDVDPAIGVLKVQETYYYYPFCDEDESSVTEIVRENSSANIDTKGPSPRYFVKDCRVCATLPFTQSDYEHYKSLSGSSSMNNTDKKVHSYSKGLYRTNNITLQSDNEAVNLKLDA